MTVWWPVTTLLFVVVFALAAAFSVVSNGVDGIVHPSVLLAFDIARHNLAALLVVVSLALISVGVLGGLVVALNGMHFGNYLLGTPATWTFAVPEVVSFCLAAGIGAGLSVDCLGWLRGSRAEFPVRELFAGARLLGVACIGIVLAAVIEAVVISTTGADN